MSDCDLRSVISVRTAAPFSSLPQSTRHAAGVRSCRPVPGNSVCVPGHYHASCRIAEGFHSQKHQSTLLVVRPVADREVGEANITSQDCRGFPVYLETTIRTGARCLARTARPKREPQTTPFQPKSAAVAPFRQQ